MAATEDHGVRIGPISLFTLVAALGLAVLSVLTISTARAMQALSERTATMTSEAYQADGSAQIFLSSIDEALVATRDAGGDRDAALATLSLGLDERMSSATRWATEYRDGTPVVTGEAKLDGSTVVAEFDTPSGRHLDVRIAINRDLSYTVTEWKATSQAGSMEVEETLWSGTLS